MTNIQTKFNFKKIKTLKTKIFLGVVSLGLTLGALSTLGSQTTTQIFTRTTSTPAFKNVSLSESSLGLQTTAWLGNLLSGLGAGLSGYQIYQNKDMQEQFELLNRRLDRIERDLKEMKQDIYEIKKEKEQPEKSSNSRSYSYEYYYDEEDEENDFYLLSPYYGSKVIVIGFKHR